MEKVIAIDGPSGSGKSSVAREVAKRLGIIYIDTGALYRAIGWYCDEKDIPFTESAELKKTLQEINLSYGESSEVLVAINGKNLTQTIREHRVSDLASKISKIPCVRDFLLQFQRDLGRKRACVMEGRDIGTVIFPQAFCKLFFTASLEERTQRRVKELATKGEQVDFKKVYADIKERDDRDSSRDVAPLKPAADAIPLDTSHLSFEEVVARVIAWSRAKAQEYKVDI